MFWFGLAGRAKIGALEARMDRLEGQMRDLDLEVTDALDKLSGIAKRFTGRKGGRPPKNGEEDQLGDQAASFSRHILP